jgi:methylglutaconyl-CoA hydratase
MMHVRVERRNDGTIGVLTLARPEKKNALDRAMADALVAGLAEFKSDARARAVLLDADGADFCAGADLTALGAMIDQGPEAHAADAESLVRVFIAIRDLPQPVIAAVQGHALAAGAGLATACDIILARDDARFGYPEVRIGFVPAMTLPMLRLAVGEKIAADLVLTGRTLAANEALALGIVSRIIHHEQWEEGVRSTLERIASSPPGPMRITKHLLYALDDLTFDDGLALGVQANVAARSTDEFRAGIRQFMQRRP